MTSTVYGPRYERGDRVASRSTGSVGTITRTDSSWQPSAVIVAFDNGARSWQRVALLRMIAEHD